jgi:GDP-L-fucose synthase
MHRMDKIYIAGHRGMVGSAIKRKLEKEGFKNLLVISRQDLNLTDQHQVEAFFQAEKPEFVFMAAAKVGGIMANATYPAEFIRDNITIQTNIIHQSYLHGVKKLLFLGSSCIYPRNAPQPMKEEYLLNGPLETTNEAYAVAKIAGIKMCQAYNKQYGTNFISVMPTNLYGPYDNFDLETSHVLAALLRKFHEAKIFHKPSVEVWGSGKPRREFLHVDDLADACLFLMQQYDQNDIINIGIGTDISVSDLSKLVKGITKCKAVIHFNHDKPDGMMRKLLDISKITDMGWRPKRQLEDGLYETYQWFINSSGYSK